MKNWIPKKTLIIASSVAAGLSVAIYVLGLFLVNSEIAKIETYYGDSESKLGREKRVAAIKTASEAYKEEIDVLRNFFIEKGDEVKFIETIEEAANVSGLKFEISALDVKSDQPKSTKEDVVVRMNVEGGWQETMIFLEKIEKMTFGVLVREISLDAKSLGVWSGFIEFVVFRNK
ncbi:MAG TPA: hypothetical protein VJB58_00195 [Candidatus Paceibacterota bacterium]